jgi:hypothetical protein
MWRGGVGFAFIKKRPALGLDVSLGEFHCRKARIWGKGLPGTCSDLRNRGRALLRCRWWRPLLESEQGYSASIPHA